MNVTQLKAKVKAAQKANADKIAKEALKATLEATLKLEGSKELFNAKVKLAVVSNNTKQLQDAVDKCAAIIEASPVHNRKTGANRVWSPSGRFSFGAQINLMYQLASGIMYSATEHKTLLLVCSGLDDQLIEQFMEAFGSPAYYSRNTNAIVEAKPYDIDMVLSTASLMQSQLGVIVDTSQLTVENFSLEFGRSELQAFKDKEAADEAIAELDMEM